MKTLPTNEIILCKTYIKDLTKHIKDLDLEIEKTQVDLRSESVLLDILLKNEYYDTAKGINKSRKTLMKSIERLTYSKLTILSMRYKLQNVCINLRRLNKEAETSEYALDEYIALAQQHNLI